MRISDGGGLTSHLPFGSESDRFSERAPGRHNELQLSEGLLTPSTAKISTGPFADSSLNPSCSWNAVNIEGPSMLVPRFEASAGNRMAGLWLGEQYVICQR